MNLDLLELSSSSHLLSSSELLVETEYYTEPVSPQNNDHGNADRINNYICNPIVFWKYVLIHANNYNVIEKPGD